MNGPIMYQLPSKTHLNQFKKYMQPLTNYRKKKVCQLHESNILAWALQPGLTCNQDKKHSTDSIFQQNHNRPCMKAHLRLEKYLVYAEIISYFVKLSSWEPISWRYRQSGLLQGWSSRSIPNQALTNERTNYIIHKELVIFKPCFWAMHDNI